MYCARRLVLLLILFFIYYYLAYLMHCMHGLDARDDGGELLVVTYTCIAILKMLCLVLLESNGTIKTCVDHFTNNMK